MEDSMAAEWYDGPEGKRKWIEDAESVEEFVKRAFEAGWTARNGQLERLAVSLDGDRELSEVKNRPTWVPPPGPLADYMRKHPGPPPVTRIKDYRYPPTADMPALPGQYTPTDKTPALPDDTNPGFKVPKELSLEHTERVWDGQEAADG